MIFFDVNNEAFTNSYLLVYFFIQIPNYAFSYAYRDDIDSRYFMYYNYVNIIKEINKVKI